MNVLGVSGDPTGKGSVAQLVDQILKNNTTDNTEIISLNRLNIKPCKGCFGCVNDNHCKTEDDWLQIEDKVREADVLVLGVPTYYGAAFNINALTHTFLERWFSLRHNGIKLNLKRVILAIVSAVGQEEMAVTGLKNFFQIYHGVQDVTIIAAKGKVPCLVCGCGETCPISLAVKIYGSDVKITEDLLPSLEKQPEVNAAICDLWK